MPINVSLKNVPDEIAEKLKKRAKRNHRSLQGELMSILEQVTENPEMTIEEVDKRLRELNLKTADDSTRWIREMRDAR
jgi:plasmid stability protein